MFDMHTHYSWCQPCFFLSGLMSRRFGWLCHDISVTVVWLAHSNCDVECSCKPLAPITELHCYTL
jgi:hypothetical protein